jgi:hypothetical protein
VPSPSLLQTKTKKTKEEVDGVFFFSSRRKEKKMQKKEGAYLSCLLLLK